MPDLVESSMNFDLQHVEPFLQRVARLVDSGFAAPEIAKMKALAEIMAHDDEQEVGFKIRYEGKPSELRIRVFMDDIAAPDLYFFSEPSLAEKISTEFERFAEENGM